MTQADAFMNVLSRHALYSLVESKRPRAGKALAGCVAVLGVDGALNDSLGHNVGDIAVRRVAAEVRARIRPDDLVFRWGDDEYLVILFGLTESSAAERFEGFPEVMIQIRTTEPLEHVVASASIGIAAFTDEESLGPAIELAEDRMHRARETRKRPGVRSESGLSAD